jgi:hypothetical protein
MGKVDLREYLEMRIKNIELSTGLAKTEMERRLDAMNEFRATLKDQAYTFITRHEFSITFDKISDDINLLRNSKANAETVNSLADDVRLLRESKAKLEGRASQTSVMIAYALAGIGLAVSIFSYFKP